MNTYLSVLQGNMYKITFPQKKKTYFKRFNTLLRVCIVHLFCKFNCIAFRIVFLLVPNCLLRNGIAMLYECLEIHLLPLILIGYLKKFINFQVSYSIVNYIWYFLYHIYTI